jgi:SAM-dependent methyltransferase
MTRAHSSHDACGASGPSPWVARFASLVPDGARVLDLACGQGRHARLFAGRGARVLAVDRDPEVLAALDGAAGIETKQVDLEAGSWPLASERFDAIVVVAYLYRPLFPSLFDALADDGTLIYETFARGNEAYGRPANPDFLLERGELLRLAEARLRVIAFEEGIVVAGERRCVVQRLAAVGWTRDWPSVLPGAAGIG